LSKSGIETLEANGSGLNAEELKQFEQLEKEANELKWEFSEYFEAK
jgi:hypothetical protein